MVVEVSAHGAEREKTKGHPFFGCPVRSTTLKVIDPLKIGKSYFLKIR